MNDYALFLGHLSSQHTQSPPAKVPCENITSTKRILKHEHNAYYTTAIGASIDAPKKKNKSSKKFQPKFCTAMVLP